MFNITFQQIEAFFMVGKYLNLSKASEVMFITQPALSKTLQRFEEGVEMQLFKRSNQGLEFTVKGEYLYTNLLASYQNIKKTINTAQSISTSWMKQLRIVAPSSYDASSNYDKLRELVGIYRKKYPDADLQQTLHDFGELRRALELGEVDLAFTQDFSLLEMKDISSKRIARFILHIAMSAKHPLANSEKLDYSALSGEVFYSVPIPKDMSVMNRSLEQCRVMGFEPKRLEFVPNFQTLMHNIRNGKGVGICGRFDCLGHDDVRYFPLPESLNTSYVVVAWQTGKLSREASDFISLIDRADLT